MVEKSNKDYANITLDLLKQQLNFDSDYTDEDNYLTQLTKASVDYCESALGFDIVPTDNSLKIEDFGRDYITVDEGNLSQITAITIDGEPVTEYKVEKKYYSFKITFEVYLSGDLEITFKTGYTTEIKSKHLQAVLIKASDLYDSERQSYNYNINKNEVLKYLLTL
jgi:hypothetical protein